MAPKRFAPYTLHKTCDSCKAKKRACNGDTPCAYCLSCGTDCLYTKSSEPTKRRLSSGSACETCRRRKTKCDGGQPCTFCAANGLVCVNNSEKRRRSMNANGDIEALEDRLKKIEALVSAFVQPSAKQDPAGVQIQQELATLVADYSKQKSRLQQKREPLPISLPSPPHHSSHPSHYVSEHAYHFSKPEPLSLPTPNISPRLPSATPPSPVDSLRLPSLSPASSRRGSESYSEAQSPPHSSSIQLPTVAQLIAGVPHGIPSTMEQLSRKSMQSLASYSIHA